MRNRVMSNIAWRPDIRFLLSVMGFMAVSVVPIWYICNLLFHSSALIGADPANHVAWIRQIVESKDLLIPLSQFYFDDPGTAYYPPLLHMIVAGLHFITRLEILDALKLFMLLVFILGQLSYALLSIKLANKNIVKGIFIYFTLSFSMALLLKTMRDGSYGEIFAFWFLLPVFVHCLLGRRVIWSALLLGAILATNIPATFGTAALVLAFLLHYAAGREWDKVKFIAKVVIIAMALASPVLYYVYFLTAKYTLQGGLEPYGDSPVVGYSTEYLALFSVGLLCTIGILLFYRQWRWLALWSALYLIIVYSPILSNISERFLRELCVPLSFSAGIVLYDVMKMAADKISGSRFWSSLKIKLQPEIALLIILAVAIVFSGMPYMASESDPQVEDYFTPLKLEAYQWLNEQTTGQEVGIVTISTIDPWAKVYVNSRVWEVLSPSVSAKLLGADDVLINDDVAISVMPPPNPDALSERNISYIILSTPLPGRWYEPENKEFATTLIDTISQDNGSYYKQVYYEQAGEEMIIIYRFDG